MKEKQDMIELLLPLSQKEVILACAHVHAAAVN
jgi:hypothetical protein